MHHGMAALLVESQEQAMSEIKTIAILSNARIDARGKPDWGEDRP
jgi:hypothetical protein